MCSVLGPPLATLGPSGELAFSLKYVCYKICVFFIFICSFLILNVLKVGRLKGRLEGWKVGWKVGRLVGRLKVWLEGWKVG